MNRKVLFTIAPAVFVMGSLVGCKGKAKVTDLTASCNKTFEVGQSINKSDIKVTATWSNKSITEPGDWTCDAFTNDTYTFVQSDVGEKEFTIKYNEKTASLKVNVQEAIINVEANYENHFYTSGEITPTIAGTKFKCTINYQSPNNINNFSFRNGGESFGDIGYKDTTGEASVNITRIYDDSSDINASLATSGGSKYIQLSEAYSKKIYVDFAFQKDVTTTYGYLRLIAQ